MPTVLVLNNEQLLGAAICRLLQAHDDLLVAGISPASAAELIEQFDGVPPDSVILVDSIEVVTEVHECLLQLHSATGLQVIAVDAVDNLVSVNGQPHVLIGGLDELVNLVRMSA